MTDAQVGKPLRDVLNKVAFMGIVVGGRPYAQHPGFRVYRVEHGGYGAINVATVGTITLDEEGRIASFSPDHAAKFFDADTFRKAAFD